MTSVNLSIEHGNFIGKQIQAFDGRLEDLYRILAVATSFRSVFKELYSSLSRSDQIESIENIPEERKKEIWNLCCHVTKDLDDQFKTSEVRIGLSKAIYLIKIIRNEY